ncbi:hypothetical protein [Hahella sp. HN01]|uniref:hypothetical protein n=1 Tax=Hahella sp. HN01 TaxID=2847262 RepID=UPI001C1ED211|nr:hypothetical protein [Hahella sp. HN01]MBU6951274.1 hypothetical protein [Hahella sp. HN01]
MKIATEFIVLHKDQKMPEEEMFCASLWRADDTDSDGDYYYYNINGRWTSLSITKREPDGKESSLSVSVYWEFDRLYEPAILEDDDLKRFIDYKHQGRYADVKAISDIEKLGVTSLSFETYSLVDYEEFLRTVYFYLDYTKGILVNFKGFNAERFKEEFLSEE